MSKKPAMVIALTPEQELQIVREARDELVRYLITKHKDEFDYISPAQAAGLIDCNPKTLRDTPIPRYPIVPGKVVKYRLSEVRAHIMSTKE